MTKKDDKNQSLRSRLDKSIKLWTYSPYLYDYIHLCSKIKGDAFKWWLWNAINVVDFSRKFTSTHKNKCTINTFFHHCWLLELKAKTKPKIAQC